MEGWEFWPINHLPAGTSEQYAACPEWEAGPGGSGGHHAGGRMFDSLKIPTGQRVCDDAMHILDNRKGPFPAMLTPFFFLCESGGGIHIGSMEEHSLKTMAES